MNSYKRSMLIITCLVEWEDITGQCEVINELLCSPYTKVNHADYNGDTALIHACCTKLTKIAMILLAQPNINIRHRNYSGDSALTWAINNNMTKVVDKLNVMLVKSK